MNNRLVLVLGIQQIGDRLNGFRNNRSTMDHQIRLESYIREVFIRIERVATVFFDLEKSYENTWEYGIMRDLHGFGLKGRLPEFTNNFLSSRTVQVRIESILSHPKNQEGIPLGSILSVILFSQY